MAAAPRLLLWLLLLGPPWRARGHPEPDANRRFAEHKLCADDECSLLMYRGKALEDFTGPDCRFVNFKKGDPVYVYYKLAGVAPEVWAGTVGLIFGYFPKDFIQVVHEYIKEELKVPADETDFVCFDGGKDDFDNYNIEELLGFLKLPESAPGDSEKAIEKTSQHVENPGVSEDSDPDSDPAEANPEESESELSRNTEELEERHEPRKNPHHTNGRTDDPQGKQPSFEQFEEMLQDKLKVPESKNNKTSNSSQVTNEQEKIDTYKLLKKEMTLDLKTKFGSTADALVSDDETTRLVTSLEDDFDEDLDDEYYIVEKEEENQENFDELPLLTFTGEEDSTTPLKSGVEKYSTDKEQNSSEEDEAEGVQPPSIENDAKNILTAWKDAALSTVTESEQQTGMDLENSSPEEKENDDALVPDSKSGIAQLAPDYVDSDKAEDGLLIVGGLDTDKDKGPEVDTGLRGKGKGRTVEKSKTDLVGSKKEPEDGKPEGEAPRGSARSSNRDSVTEQDGAALRSAFDTEESDPKGTVVRVSKEMLHEEKPGEQLLEGGSESGSERRAAGNQTKEERLGRESSGSPPPLGDEQHNASSQDRAEEEAGVSVNGPEPHMLPEERRREEWKTHDQPRFSPGEAEGAALGGRRSRPQERGAAAVAGAGPALSQAASAQPRPGAHVENQEVRDDDDDEGDDGLEELLEDENAASAQRAGEEEPGRAGAGAAAAAGPDTGPDTDTGPGGPRADATAQLLTPELGAALQGAAAEDRADLGPEGRPGASGLAEQPGGREGAGGPGGPGAAHGGDLRIIRSFLDEGPALRRLRAHLDAGALEAMLQDAARRLRAAQRDSAPRDAEKARDRALRAAEAQILRAAEAMLDARARRPGGPGAEDEDEDAAAAAAAVLDDVQDLIYFVRYTHAAGEDAAPLATPQPPDAEEVQPPLEDSFFQENTDDQESFPQENTDDQESFPQENTDDLQMQNPEGLSPWDQSMTSDMNVSDASEKPNTEEAVDSGIITTDSIPAEAADGKEQEEAGAGEPARVAPLENAILVIYSSMYYLTKTLVAALPDDVQPGPDFYGLPWKPVLVTAFLGIVSFVIFFWRTILVVKNRVYQVTEQQISEKLKNITKENAELVQKLSDYEQKIKESKKHVQETKKQNIILSDEAIKFKDKIKKLEETNESLNDTAKSLRVMLDSERDQNAKNQDLILENKKSLEKLKDVIAMNSSELSEVQIALNEAKLSEEKVKSECHRVQEENTRLKKKKEQLQQEIKDWSKSHAELSEQIRSFESCQKDLEVTLTRRDDSVNALTNCITQLNRLDCESESRGQDKGGNESDELANGEVGADRSEKLKNQIKQMMDISRTQTAISVVEEDLKLLQLKLRASMSTKCNLEDQIKKLEDDRDSLQSAKAGLEDECKTLRQKVEILNELYQQKEMALQKKLSQEEYERQEREQRLSAADEKAVLAAEEVKTYKRRIEEMEDELQKTERAFKNQIATHEKKAHDNWLKARAAERAMAEEKREAANLRHKLLELTQKMALLQEEPAIVRPMPGRPSAQNPPRRGPLSQNGSFGPSPVSGGECSPPPDLPVRPLSATLGRGDVPRRDLGSADGPLPRPRWSSEAPGKPSASEPASGAAPMTNSSSRSSSPSKATDEGKVNAAAKGPPPFPGAPLLSSPVGGPLLPPIRYGPPPQLCGPFGPRPLPPPFGPGFRPPLGLREYPPGVPPGVRDLPLDPREFLPGHSHFRPLGSHGPREYFFPGTRLPAPAHGPQEYPPPPAARDAPPPAPESRSQDSSPALKQSP